MINLTVFLFDLYILLARNNREKYQWLGSKVLLPFVRKSYTHKKLIEIENLFTKNRLELLENYQQTERYSCTYWIDYIKPWESAYETYFKFMIDTQAGFAAFEFFRHEFKTQDQFDVVSNEIYRHILENAPIDEEVEEWRAYFNECVPPYVREEWERELNSIPGLIGSY